MMQPDALLEWRAMVDDPWNCCRRGDWMVLLAAERGVGLPMVVRELAAALPDFPVPEAVASLGTSTKELLSAVAKGTMPMDEIRVRARAEVRPQIVDWNIAEQYPAPAPDGIPQPAPAAARPLQRAANALLKLVEAAYLESQDDRSGWGSLSLVALHVVFEASGGGSPLYNHVEMREHAQSTDASHALLCGRLRRLR